MLRDRVKSKAKSRVKSKAKSRVRGAVRDEGGPKVLKATAVGGTAYYAGKKISDKDQGDQCQAPQGETYTPPPPSGAGTTADSQPDMATQLQKLAHLHDSGILTDEEFAAAKQKVLAV